MTTATPNITFIPTFHFSMKLSTCVRASIGGHGRCSSRCLPSSTMSERPAKGEPAGAKPAGLSSKILGLKFMQRAQEKKALAKAEAEAEAREEAAANAPPDEAPPQPEEAAPSTSGKCQVVYENAPIPMSRAGFSAGRFSFGGKPVAPAAAAASTAAKEEPDAAAAAAAAGAAGTGADANTGKAAKPGGKTAKAGGLVAKVKREREEATVSDDAMAQRMKKPPPLASIDTSKRKKAKLEGKAA
ncbi:hypothetical protein FOA52_016203 [Chlamydomonas sp. UWO 241]|nr:hypothetical protein FOA52_016203 [Chlamydomonas sp. UWO 241]